MKERRRGVEIRERYERRVKKGREGKINDE